MDTPLRIGILHYSCPPVVGGVEEILGQQASIFHRMGHSVSVLAGMGEVYTKDFHIRIEPGLSSKNTRILKAQEECKKGHQGALERPTNRVYKILKDWSHELDVILAHNVLHMPFNLPLTLALRRLADSGNGPAVVSWAHDSPYFQPNPPKYLNSPPWLVLQHPHPNIHYVTVSESRMKLFKKHCGGVPWKVIHNGIDPVRFFYLDQRSVKLSEELNLFSRDLVVVQPSRITPRKNLELSIHIIRGIKLLGYNVLFILTGAYDPHEERAVAYYRRLKYWINELGLQDNIAVLAEYRFRDRTKLVPDRIFIRDLYLMADLLLMTSKDEGFGLPLLEAGMIKLPIACSEIAPFQEVGEGICFFRLDEPPLFIAGRIMEYLGRTDTHKMFRNVMRRYVWDVICKREVLPFLRKITSQPMRNGKK
ncbi:MAG: glycosyltransferase family 4 protein [Deltaproteobacteria bacterium]|nr:glycosyltransferase family 4 protein [Deltaproteobacteria bacterium]MBW2018888.1 glycosyltransferase family 4 protein [Deltaproteobacteria bacterium]MBW2073643.1 glycosyltransferase family 4 protein [Deltaproteobacteria bacterium]